MSAGGVYRKAARHMEKNPNASAFSGHYPCFAVRANDPYRGSYMDGRTSAWRFICAMCPGKSAPRDGEVASDRFLRHVQLDTPAGHDLAILSLCFAAAMADTGDLP